MRTMISFWSRLSVALVVAVSGFVFALGAARAEAQEGPASQLANLRAGVRAGALPNGFRYVIVPTGGLPRDLRGDYVRIGLHIAVKDGVDGGDMAELPHLLEHLLANLKSVDGTEIRRTDYPKYFDVPDGSYMNAHPDNFWFKVPASKVNLAISQIRAIANGRNFNKEEVDIEKNIVSGEWMLFGKLSPKSIIAFSDRSKTILNSLGAERRLGGLKKVNLEDVNIFYKAHYRADAETLYIVGDVDVSAMEDEVRQRFSDIPAGASKSAGLLPAPDLSKGLVQYWPERRGSYAILNLDYQSSAKDYSKRQLALHSILASMLRSEWEERNVGMRFPSLDVDLGKSIAAGEAYSSAIDIGFTVLPGEFAAASAEIATAIRAIASGKRDGQFEKAKEDFAATLPNSYEVRCLGQDAIHAGLVVAEQKGRFGEIDCLIGITFADVAPLTIADLRKEAARLLNPAHFGFRAGAPAGSKEVSLANLRKAFRLNGQVFRRPSEMPKLPSALEIPSPPPEVKLLQVRGDISRVVLEGGPPLYVERTATGGQFSLRLFGLPATALAADDLHFADENGVKGTASRLAELSGFGGLAPAQLQEYLRENDLQFRVGITRSESSIDVTGPSGKLNEGLNLLYHLIVGPAPDIAFRERYAGQPIGELCNINAFTWEVWRSFQFGSNLPRTWNQLCDRHYELPDDAKLRSIWKIIFGDTSKWTLVARGADEQKLAAALGALIEGPPVSSSESANQPTAASPILLRNGHTIISDAEHPFSATVKIYIPFKLNGEGELEEAYRSLTALFPRNGKFWYRIRMVEAGAYAPDTLTYRYPYPGRPDAVLLVIDFTCDPADVDRLVDATWDELAKIQRNGLDAEEIARVNALQPVTIRRIDETYGADRYALTEKEASASRTITPLGAQDVLNILRTAKREDMQIFELRR